MDKIPKPKKEEILEFFEKKSQPKEEKDLKIMDSLQCELEIRKNLNEKCSNLLKNKEENILKLKEFEKFYSYLPNYLTNIENSTLKAQNFFNLNSIINKKKDLNLLSKLPNPLYVLFSLLQCFNNDFAKCDVKICGKEENVNSFYNEYMKFFDGFNSNNNANEFNNNNYNKEDNKSGKNFDEEINIDDNNNNKVININNEGDINMYENNNANNNPSDFNSLKITKEEGEHSEGEIEDEDINLTEKKKKKKKKRKNNFNLSSDTLNINLKNNNNDKIFNYLTNEDLNLFEYLLKNNKEGKKIKKFPLWVELNINKMKIEDGDPFINYDFFPIKICFYFIPLINVISVDVINTNNLNNANNNLNNDIENNNTNNNNNNNNNDNTKEINDLNNKENPKNFLSFFNTSHLFHNIFKIPHSIFGNLEEKMEKILMENCYEFKNTEKIYDYIQLLSSNNLLSLKGCRDFVKFFEILDSNYYKNKYRNKSINSFNNINNKIDNENEDIIKTNPFNSFNNSLLTHINTNQNQSFNFNNNIYNNFFPYNDFENTNDITIDNLISKIRERIIYIPSLFSQIDHIFKYKEIKQEILEEFKYDKKFQFIKEKSNIISITNISKKEYQLKYNEIFNHNNNSNNNKFYFSSFFNSEKSQKIYSSNNNNLNNFPKENEALFLLIIFERKNFRLNSYVQIRFNYPNFIPKYFFTLENIKNNNNNNINENNIPENLKEFLNKENNMEDFKPENCGFSNIIREMENEVNEFSSHNFKLNSSNEFFNKNNNFILWNFSYQIRLIKMCLDIFVERENPKYRNLFEVNCNTNKILRPFSFNEILKNFNSQEK
jgi:hypothetical protein